MNTKKLSLIFLFGFLFAFPVFAQANVNFLEEWLSRIKPSAPPVQIENSQPAQVGLPDDYGTNQDTEASENAPYCPQLSTTMQRGARDATTNGQVSELQRFFSDYYDLDPEEIVSGFFGRITQGYVVQFQKEQGLPAFGIVGSLTRATIAKTCGGEVVIQPPSINVDVDGNFLVIVAYNNLPRSTIVLVSVASGQEVSKELVSGSGGVELNERGTPTGQYYIKAIDRSTGREVARSNAFYLGDIPQGTSPTITSTEGPQTLKIGEAGQWFIIASDPSKGSLNYSVTWGDEGLLDRFLKESLSPRYSSGQKAMFTHAYQKAGKYTPVFRVTNESGLEAKTSLSVSVIGETVSPTSGLYEIYIDGKIAFSRDNVDKAKALAHCIDTAKQNPSITSLYCTWSGVEIYSRGGKTTLPSCTLTAEGSFGAVGVADRNSGGTGEGSITIKKGEQLKIGWTSKNANYAVGPSGDKENISGNRVYTPTQTTGYQWIFYGTEQKTDCSVTVNVISEKTPPPTTSNMSITSPTGGEIFKVGDTIKVFIQVPNKKTGTVKATLITQDGKLAKLLGEAKFDDNRGLFILFPIIPDVPVGNNYLISTDYTYDDAGKIVLAGMNNAPFSITNVGTPPPTSRPQSPFILYGQDPNAWPASVQRPDTWREQFDPLYWNYKNSPKPATNPFTLYGQDPNAWPTSVQRPDTWREQFDTLYWNYKGTPQSPRVGSYTVTNDTSSTPLLEIQNTSEGVEDVVLARYIFTAGATEAVDVKQIVLQLGHTTENSPDDLYSQRVTIWNDATRVGEATFFGSIDNQGNTDYAISMLETPIRIPGGGSVALTIKGTLVPQYSGDTRVMGTALSIDYDGDSNGLNGNYAVGVTSGNVINGTSPDTKSAGIRIIPRTNLKLETEVPRNAGVAIGNDLNNCGQPQPHDGQALAFDGNVSQDHDHGFVRCGATANDPAYIGKDWGIGQQKTITTYLMYGSTNYGFTADQPGVEYQLQGSNDNSKWVPLNLQSVDDQQASIGAGGLSIHNTPYRYHRIRVWSSFGTANILISEVKFYEVPNRVVASSIIDRFFSSIANVFSAIRDLVGKP